MAAGTIFAESSACQAALTTCLSEEELTKHGWAENRLADFNLWAAGIGALANGRTSLDHRLELLPETRDVVSGLLQHLTAIVQRCVHLGRLEDEQLALYIGLTVFLARAHASDDLSDAGHTSYHEEEVQSQTSESSSNSSSTADGTELKLRRMKKKVESRLDQLVRLAASLRRAGTRSRLLKADKRFNVEDHPHLCAHLFIVIASKFHSPDFRLDPIQRRLIEANLRRRNRFVYAQRHAASLNPKRKLPDEAAIETTGVSLLSLPYSWISAVVQPAVAITQLSQSMLRRPTAVNTEEVRRRGQLSWPEVKPGTSASRITDYRPPKPTSTPSLGATTQMSTTLTKVVYPRPPEVAIGARVFKCPCCCQSLPTELSIGDRWK